jgi:ABC-2 type transport system ATP-binding protein
LHDPAVLILDEPTASIDPVQVVETRDLVKSLGQEHTIIFSTHILSEAGAVSQRVVVINEGHIVAEDRPDNLAVRLRGSEQVQLEVRGPGRDIATKLREVEGVTKVTRQEQPGGINLFTLECRPGANVKEELAALVVRNNWGLLSLQSVKMSLEDIFLRLTLGSERKEEAAS